MSYPQPDSNASVLGGQNFFRINTMLQGPGDIYESDQGSLAVALGPDSDIANVNVYYFDELVASRVNSLQISPDRSFVGLLAAHPTENYPVVNLPGRVLIAPADQFDSSFRPATFNFTVGVGDVIDFVTPVLDVIQYFSQPPSLIPQRSDKEYEFESIQQSAALCTYWLVVPAYGRKYASFNFRNNLNQSVSIGITGAKLGVSNLPAAAAGDARPSSAVQGVIKAVTAVAVNAQLSSVYLASTMGSWDYFVISYTPALLPTSNFGLATHITVSDDAL